MVIVNSLNKYSIRHLQIAFILHSKKKFSFLPFVISRFYFICLILFLTYNRVRQILEGNNKIPDPML